MLRTIRTGVLLGALAFASFTGLTFAAGVLTPPRDCYAFIGRDGSERVFLLNKCDGSVRVLVMPSPPPVAQNELKPRI